MDFPENLSELSADQLAELRTAAMSALDAFAALEGAPTAPQLAEASEHDTHLEAIDGELASRQAAVDAAASIRDRQAARIAASSTEAEQAEADRVAAEAAAAEQAQAEAAAAAEAESAAEAERVATEAANAEAARVAAAAALAGNRPDLPGNRNRSGSTATIRIAQDVPGVPVGTTFARMSDMADALVERMHGYLPPTGDGSAMDWRNHSFARISKGIPAEHTIRDRATEEEFWEVINRAVDETRLPGGGLVAAGGWCSPSEVSYDLCEGESLDGILSSPEVGLSRGGMKYTMGPDWSDIYGNGFGVQTETQAIAGVAKVPFEITCPSFIETRLDAIYQFVKVPILTEATYPELVKRWMRGLTVSYAHKVNARHIAQIVAALGTAQVATDVGTTAGSLADALLLIGDTQRNIRRWKFNQALEIVMPFWLKGAIKADIGLRTGRTSAAVTDAEVQAIFTQANMLAQWVYDWQDLADGATTYPATVQVAIYKAGTFVKGGTDVIKLDTVYDAASLAQNIYTALFMEEGMNTMRMCPGGKLVTVPLCNSGRLGAQNIDLCTAP